MWAWIEFNRHKTKLSGGLLYRGGSCTTTLTARLQLVQYGT